MNWIGDRLLLLLTGAVCVRVLARYPFDWGMVFDADARGFISRLVR
ncbi:hypothetical protein [Burkholderia glumae]|uniref:Uncharacterized protein n=1 Tax=Burkholderia glumae TaxID=337 RepID=A0ABY5BDR5_BURGL|nr:hypothetical protein [Burkholderia glumae]MCM2482729.1 hypothetical protein [Burkholderia glumae]MCM2507129.1 hypothetical protein [Burkholderia glumae]MCM2548392.1 hypothetical protein [Burkholderia glumae]USS45170.1 hypothetical protein NFI99_26645 [Burkholderia glumae]